MICSTCGIETPNDSRFCCGCGDSFVAGIGPAGRAAKSQLARIASLALGILLLAGLGYYGYASQKRHSSYSFNLAPFNPIDHLTKKPHSLPVATDEFAINQLGYSYFKLEVPAKASSVTLHGTFTANGGLQNTAEAFVLSPGDYLNWQKRQDVQPFYSSGRVTMGTIDANLPSGAGTYYLVFNNKFSPLAPVSIRLDANLTYYAK